MSKRISFSGLRLWTTAEYALPASSTRRAAEVQALLDAVEAAQRFTRTSPDWTNPDVQAAYGRLRDTLARFDFGNGA